MTLTEEITICANILANQGKKPTVALIKSKLSQRAPLVTIISTLKSWQHQPDYITSKTKEEDSNKTTTTKNTEIINKLVESGSIKRLVEDTLAQELTKMKQELLEMKLLVTNLSEQLSRNNKK